MTRHNHRLYVHRTLQSQCIMYYITLCTLIIPWMHVRCTVRDDHPMWQYGIKFVRGRRHSFSAVDSQNGQPQDQLWRASDEFSRDSSFDWFISDYNVFLLFFNFISWINRAYAYWKVGRHEEQAVFDLFFRKNPFKGEFTVFAGLSEVSFKEYI